MQQTAHISSREELDAALPHNQHLPNLFSVRLTRFTDVCRRVGLPPVIMSPRCAKTVLPTSTQAGPLDNLAMQDLVWSLRGAILGLIPCVRTADHDSVVYRIKVWSRSEDCGPRQQQLTAVAGSNLAGEQRIRLLLPDEPIAPLPPQSTILLVEDEVDVAELEQLILEAVGFRVLWSANGLEGLYLARSEGVAAAVLDLELPGMSGSEICQRIKFNADTQHLPVVFLSGSPQAPQLAAAACADKILSKPQGITQLAAVVGELLKR